MGAVSYKDRVTNEDVLKKLKTERNLLKTIKQRKLRYFGHVKRQNGLLKQTLEGRIEGTRPIGRPQTTWVDNIQEWTGRKKSECTQACKDRNLWSVIARQPLQRR